MSAARSVFRSGAGRSAVAALRSTKPMPSSVRSPFGMPKQRNPLSHQIFRSPVQLSCCVETMLPYHTATASACLIPCFRFHAAPFGPSEIATMMHDEFQMESAGVDAVLRQGVVKTVIESCFLVVRKMRILTFKIVQETKEYYGILIESDPGDFV